MRENCLAKGTQKSKNDKDQESINQEQPLTLGMKNGKNTRKHQTQESQEVSLFTADNNKDFKEQTRPPWNEQIKNH